MKFFYLITDIMRKIFSILCLVFCLLFVSCEKETLLNVPSSSISFDKSGGSQSLSFTANKVWSASSSASWCKVSPSSGDATKANNVIISISCDANPDFDDRNCTVTVVCMELSKSIQVTQSANDGLIISQTSYDLTSDAQTISVEVKTNVQFGYTIDSSCSKWVKASSTKGLASNIVKFEIAKNDEYDAREGKIIFNQNNGTLSGTVTIKQAQSDAIVVDVKDYKVSSEQQTLDIKVKSNVRFEVKVDDACKDWISVVGTKALTESAVSLAIKENAGGERSGLIFISYGEISGHLQKHGFDYPYILQTLYMKKGRSDTPLT